MLLVLCLLVSFAMQIWLLAKLASKSEQAPNTDVGQTVLASFARPLRIEHLGDIISKAQSRLVLNLPVVCLHSFQCTPDQNNRFG